MEVHGKCDAKVVLRATVLILKVSFFFYYEGLIEQITAAGKTFISS